VVFCWGFQQTIGRGFYAKQETLTPAILGTITTLLSLPIFHFLTAWLHAIGVAMASAVSIALYTGILSFWWRYRFGEETFSGLGKDTIKITALSLVASVRSFLIVRFDFTDRITHPSLAAIYVITAGGVCSGVLFGVLASYFIPALTRSFLVKLGPIGAKFIR
jgi:putative peptidoglycan lipid II flippase